MVSSCHTVLLAIITTEYAVGNDTDPGKYATMKHRVKSVTCRTVKKVYGLSNPLAMRKARRQGGCQGLNVERAKDRIIRQRYAKSFVRNGYDTQQTAHI